MIKVCSVKYRKTVFIDKTPGNSFRIDKVAKGFPNGVVINIKRNGFDNFKSRQIMWKRNGGGELKRKVGDLFVHVKEGRVPPSQIPKMIIEQLVGRIINKINPGFFFLEKEYYGIAVASFMKINTASNSGLEDN